jgi:hypothetical protein
LNCKTYSKNINKIKFPATKLSLIHSLEPSRWTACQKSLKSTMCDENLDLPEIHDNTMCKTHSDNHSNKQNRDPKSPISLHCEAAEHSLKLL